MNYKYLLDSSRNLIFISLACTLVLLLLSKTRFSGSVRYLCGIVLLLFTVSAISPLVSALGDVINTDFSFSDEDNGSESSDDLIISQSASYICKYVKTLISQKYNIHEDNISVSVTLDGSNRENIVIKNVTLYFINTDESLYPQIMRYVSDMLACECIILSK